MVWEFYIISPCKARVRGAGGGRGRGVGWWLVVKWG